MPLPTKNAPSTSAAARSPPIRYRPFPSITFLPVSMPLQQPTLPEYLPGPVLEAPLPVGRPHHHLERLLLPVDPVVPVRPVLDELDVLDVCERAHLPGPGHVDEDLPLRNR